VIRKEGWYWIRYEVHYGMNGEKTVETCPAYWSGDDWVRVAWLDYAQDADAILEVCPDRIREPWEPHTQGDAP
jgi:hypothetical protein